MLVDYFCIRCALSIWQCILLWLNGSAVFVALYMLQSYVLKIKFSVITSVFFFPLAFSPVIHLFFLSLSFHHKSGDLIRFSPLLER